MKRYITYRKQNTNFIDRVKNSLLQNYEYWVNFLGIACFHHVFFHFSLSFALTINMICLNLNKLVSNGPKCSKIQNIMNSNTPLNYEL